MKIKHKQVHPLKFIKSPKALIYNGLLFVIILASFGCSYDGRMTTFESFGPVAEVQGLLFDVLIWVMAIVFVLVEFVLIYAAIKYRHKPGAPLPKQTHGNTTLEITWTIIPTILVLGLGMWSLQVLWQIQEPPKGSEPLEIVATGHQWWFEFNYPDAANGKAITTANELKIPVGRPVSLILRSDDVIHSFWVPKLAGKQDMVPTRSNPLWFMADEEGYYYGQCAEYCGTQHALMKMAIKAVSEEEYLTWVEGYGEKPYLSEEAQQGQQVFNGKGQCITCHTASGPDSEALVQARVNGFLSGSAIAPGPNLTDLATRDKFAAGIYDRTSENLKDWITNPNELKSGNYMYKLAQIYKTEDGVANLTESEIEALVEYLQSLK
ncbi:MAG TPA: cytochrome c oxidase subunit II [Dehalococcoidia bacterium]|jgi:cytochrome c oxidase subunit 2|nr:cytochrome c oxidase subunit II [Dehalococcoidia bacterium]|tara:strand:- start:382 stop:1518 length:1137 start_codon:yes stop_codon:yes gene_type:complete